MIEILWWLPLALTSDVLLGPGAILPQVWRQRQRHWYGATKTSIVLSQGLWISCMFTPSSGWNPYRNGLTFSAPSPKFTIVQPQRIRYLLINRDSPGYFTQHGYPLQPFSANISSSRIFPGRTCSSRLELTCCLCSRYYTDSCRVPQ